MSGAISGNRRDARRSTRKSAASWRSSADGRSIRRRRNWRASFSRRSARWLAARPRRPQKPMLPRRAGWASWPARS